MFEIKLSQLPSDLKKLVFLFNLVLAVGISIGLVYLATTSGTSSTTIKERYNGSQIVESDEFAIPEKYPKPLAELLITTHGHIIQFALIYFLTGFLFYFNKSIRGTLKLFLMLEPLVSSLLTFGGIWAMRFWHPSFVYLVMLSGILMYPIYFIMAGVIAYETFPIGKSK